MITLLIAAVLVVPAKNPLTCYSGYVSTDKRGEAVFIPHKFCVAHKRRGLR